MTCAAERYRDFAARADMTGRPHESMAGCVNLTAAYGDVRVVNFMAKAVPRDDVDRINAVMIMRGEPNVRSRIRRPDPQSSLPWQAPHRQPRDVRRTSSRPVQTHARASKTGIGKALPSLSNTRMVEYTDGEVRRELVSGECAREPE